MELQTGRGASGEEEEPGGVEQEEEINGVLHISHTLIESECVNEHLTTIPLSNGSIAQRVGLEKKERTKGNQMHY